MPISGALEKLGALFVPQVYATLLLLFVTTNASPAHAQQNYVLPNETDLARLVWTSMIAVDNANRTGNYSIVHSLGSPEFQDQNSIDDLSALFSNLRSNRVDVGKAVLLEPTYHIPPAISDDGILRLRGGFEYRPRAIRFDILFKNQGAGWRIHAISVAEMDSSIR